MAGFRASIVCQSLGRRPRSSEERPSIGDPSRLTTTLSIYFQSRQPGGMSLLPAGCIPGAKMAELYHDQGSEAEHSPCGLQHRHGRLCHLRIFGCCSSTWCFESPPNCSRCHRITCKQPRAHCAVPARQRQPRWAGLQHVFPSSPGQHQHSRHTGTSWLVQLLCTAQAAGINPVQQLPTANC